MKRAKIAVIVIITVVAAALLSGCVLPTAGSAKPNDEALLLEQYIPGSWDDIPAVRTVKKDMRAYSPFFQTVTDVPSDTHPGYEIRFSDDEDKQYVWKELGWNLYFNFQDGPTLTFLNASTESDTSAESIAAVQRVYDEMVNELNIRFGACDEHSRWTAFSGPGMQCLYSVTINSTDRGTVLITMIMSYDVKTQ